ncbi:MAG: transcriptional regulator [Lysobacterales bacterium CG17_big_fil_post_rev_8_21_14_2_50_64_11]|nr:MAG: transcriptional regulator [Xanthomonadales bacterium CG17_big_fil_post_rev_8_21_14_2_50_64_11]PIX60504.1 MAG: transcriptional regulator [Xanthomonadales bacterium CG_4_10_14_3_um_filter_64_11]
MERYERILAIHRVLKSARHPVSLACLLDETGASRATLYRDIAFLRDALGAPLDADGDGRVSYRGDEAERFELPGLWLSPEELHALLATHQLLTRTGPDVLGSALAPLKGRIDALLAQQAGGKRWPMERVRVIATGTRRLDEHAFRTVATAVLERKRLNFDYRARSTDAASKRSVSPQRLTHYRDNWYMDAFDHEREALRSFAVDRISAAHMLATNAHDLPDQELNQHLASSYGIFSGTPKATATVLFSAKAARWVADEHWHSNQQGRFLPDGRYELKLPYSNARELLMDVLRYGADAEVVAPPALRAQIRSLLQLALGAYEH